MSFWDFYLSHIHLTLPLWYHAALPLPPLLLLHMNMNSSHVILNRHHRCSVIRHRWMKLYAGNTLAFCSGSICFHYPNPKSCYPLLLCPSRIVAVLLWSPPLSSVTARNCPKAFKLRWKVKARPQVIWFGRHRNGCIWLTIPHCLMWCLWRERNNGCFEDNERSIPDLKLFFFKTLLNWLAAMRNQSFFTFLDSCNFYT